MSQNSFIQQYLAKQQELLRQKLEREAQQDDNTAGMTQTQVQTGAKSNLCYKGSGPLCHVTRCWSCGVIYPP